MKTEASAAILLVLLSFVQPKSTVKHATFNATYTQHRTKDSPAALSVDQNSVLNSPNKSNKTDSNPVEPLLASEDQNRYTTIPNQIQKPLIEGNRSTNGTLQTTSNNVKLMSNDDNRKPDTIHEKLEEKGTQSSGKTENKNEVKHKQTNKPETLNEECLELRNSPDVEKNLKILEKGAETSQGVASRTKVGSERIESVEEEEDKEDQDGGRSEPDEEDLIEAANFGLEAMKNLYLVKEPTLYSMGIYLDADNPARYVALFNGQTEEARELAKYGFAVLQSTTMFKKKFPDTLATSPLIRRGQTNPLQHHCPNRGIPDCPPASLRYRTSDGSCNNLQNLWWGSAMSPMQRFLQPVYDDGVQSIRKSVTGKPLPSARIVTTAIHADKDVPLASVTHMLMQWGQFVDHDLTATGQSRGFNGSIPQCCLNFGTGFQRPEFMHPECLPISVNPQDTFFGPLGVRCLEFLRSGAAPKENCEFGPREQLTQVTSYLDASTVYSSNAFQTDTLRLFRNGLLQYGKLQSQRPVLPRQAFDLCRRGSLSTTCFRAGDGRLSEQPALTSLHVVFLRLHNRLATKLAALNPHWSDEKLFQEARRIVGAVVQHITYREFLPIVLGQDVMKIFNLEVLRKGYYEGYDPEVNPTIANEFSTAAYRFGHSLVQHSFVRFDGSHVPLFNNVSIHEEFSNPVNLETAGSVDRLLLGLINQPAQKRDEHITEELTNHLFQTPSFRFGMDLASINIQRGRDHGVPPYVKWREPCGLAPIKSFEDLTKTMSPSIASKFKTVYSSVEDIDLFTAGLAEKSVNGGLVGPTFACIIAQQFSNLRKGDRFWHENPGEGSFTPGQLQQIRRCTLAQVLCATMDDIQNIQPFVFLVQDSLRNQRLACNDSVLAHLDLEFWREKSEFQSRGGLLGLLKKKDPTPGPTQSPVQNTKLGTQKQSTNQGQLKIFPQRVKPSETSISQQNRIVLKRPLGPSDNITVVVNNNAVNSPIFVSDSIYGSNVKIDPSSQTQEINVRPTQAPGSDNRPQSLPSVPVFGPPKPIPTVPPFVNSVGARPYVPLAYSDPNNPNPLSQGYQSVFGTEDVVFESYPGTSPRPTLYTYYTNFQRPTQRPEVDPYAPRPGPLANSGPQYHQKPIRNSYEAENWLKLQQDLVDNHGSWNLRRPGDVYGMHGVVNGDPGNWATADRFGHGDRPLGGFGPNGVPSYQGTFDRDRYQLGRPGYQDNYHTGQQHGYQGNYGKPGYQHSYDKPGYQSNYEKPGYQINYEKPEYQSNYEKPGYQSNYEKPEYQSSYNKPGYGSNYDKANYQPNYQANRRPTKGENWSSISTNLKESDRVDVNQTPSYQDSNYKSSSSPTKPKESEKIDVRQTPSYKSPSYPTSSKDSDRLDVHSQSYPADIHQTPSYLANPKESNQMDVHSQSYLTRPKDSDGEDVHPPSYLTSPKDSDILNISSPNHQTLNYKTPSHLINSKQSNTTNIHQTPTYQTPSYQNHHNRGSTIRPESLYLKSPSERPSTEGFMLHSHQTKSSDSTHRPLQQNLKSLQTQEATIESQDVKHDRRNSSVYQNLIRPKPTKVYSVTIVTEKTMNQGEDRIKDLGINGTSWPLPVQAIRPGQYYFEKNVLRRYPDKVKDRGSVGEIEIKEKHKSVDGKIDGTIVDGVDDENMAIVDANGGGEEKMNQGVKETGDIQGDKAETDIHENSSEDEEKFATIRMTYWMNPEEDSSLPSTPEMPKMALDKASAVNELPKPIKCRRHDL